MLHIQTLAEIERSHVLNTLLSCESNRTQAAKILGISIRGLRLKLHQYQQQGFEVPPPPRMVAKSNSGIRDRNQTAER